MPATSPAVTRRAFLQVGTAAVSAAGLAARLSAETPVWQPTTDRRIRIGVVGGGFGCSFHWNEHPNAQVVAVSDLLPDRRQRLQQVYGCETAYPSLAELIRDPQVEAVAVFTGAPDHARHVLECFAAGKHVICAVPACLTLDEAHQLKEAKERTGLTYMMAETSHYRWETITARRLYRDGLFGTLPYVEAEYYHPFRGGERDGLFLRDGQRTWRWGLTPMLYPTHTTSFLVSVTGERLTKVSCVGLPGADEAFRPDNNAYQNGFASQVAMFTTSGGNAFRGNVCWDLEAHGERAQWIGTRAAYYMGGSGGQPHRIVFTDGQQVSEQPDYWHAVPEAMRRDSGHGRSHPFLSHEFILALLEEREPEVSLYEALAMTVPGIVADESSRRDGEQLAIPSFDPA